MSFKSTLLSILWILPLLSCSTAPVENPSGFELSQEKTTAKKLWSKTFPGRISDLSISGDDNRVLVALVPDPDATQQLGMPTLVQMNDEGDILWRLALKSRIKSQALSRNGDLVVTTTYDEQVTAYNGDGKPLWNYEALCSPIILSQ